MLRYAAINDGVVTGIQSSPKAIAHPSLILLDSTHPNIGDTYNDGVFSAGDTSALEKINITITVDKHMAKVGDTITFTAKFSDPSMSIASIPVSLTDRENKHLANMEMSVVPGVIESTGTGTYVLTKPLDYRVTYEGINHWKNMISAELTLTEELLIRVTD